MVKEKPEATQVRQHLEIQHLKRVECDGNSVSQPMGGRSSILSFHLALV